MTRFISSLLPYLLITGLLMGITALFDYYDGLAGLWWHKIIELPLVLYLYYLFRQLLHDRRGGWLLAALPVIIMYVLIDGYFLLFGRVFRLSEIHELPELVDILPWYFSVPIGIVLLAPFVWVLIRLRIRSFHRLLWSILPGVLLVGSLLLRPDLFITGFLSAANGIVEWSDEVSVRWNGRFSMVLYHEAKRRSAMRQAREYLGDEAYEQQYARTMAALQETLEPRNIHLFVLESFFDPRRFSHLNLNQDAIHPEFRKLLVDGEGDLFVSPVWGGYTAQAEFEILCGVPALQKLGTIEFNVFSGAPLHCLPEVLRESGYQTISSRGFKPFFFNSMVAMDAMGFAESYYAREYAPNRETYLSTGDVSVEEFMFDAHMLKQNLEFVRERMASRPTEPLLNYVLTIYGHYPYRIDENLRPRVIKPLGPAKVDDELDIMLNQIHYRSRAIADAITELIELDPEALIIMISDHLPPLREGIGGYERLGYLGGEEGAAKQTLLAVIDRGKPLKVGKRYQYELPQLIYQLVSANRYCDKADCAPRDKQALQADYMRFMAHAVSGPP